jgi:hypothetical protein
VGNVRALLPEGVMESSATMEGNDAMKLKIRVFRKKPYFSKIYLKQRHWANMNDSFDTPTVVQNPGWNDRYGVCFYLELRSYTILQAALRS